MKIHWSSAGRHYLQVIAFCCVVAVLTTAIWPNKTYLVQVGYALSVGTITWSVIEFGRYLVDERHCEGGGPGRGHGWPQGWRGLLLTAIGIACGFLAGDRVGDFLFNYRNVSSSRDNTISLVITVVAGAAASFYFHARGKAAALIAKIATAERDAGEARLKLLETQLEPHMLFNTLANLRALITVDPPRAVEMLDHLNNYLRVTLAASRATAHPLAREFERLRDYLELMSVRMGPRLRFALDLPDALRELPVPPLLLQPLVENSIRHGLEPKVEGGEIRIRALRENRAADGLPQIRIEILDTGVGLGTGPPSEGGGFGVTQVRERLATVYGARGSLTLEATAAGGTLATVVFPT
ncbi:histidine kinase [Variovorax sp. J31P179]|uniref:sensor histidine kinase n=1 Tax=Variovorax sp. J31P179 TaxID=3053508 RepID=UPI0025790C82|nr:histidine kinase [Variovorax sp. J31P179]MDM0084079.1 histidine kinase [Variovorax sp. J31P179]HET7835313.1 histidine kinase [Variovorax sp.]